MKSIATTLVFATAIAFASVAWAGPTYTEADLVGGYACGLTGTMVSSTGTTEKAVGTGTIDLSGTGTFIASTMVVNVQGVGECNYKMDITKSNGDTFYPDGTGVATGTYLLTSGSGCQSEILGIISLACAGGQFPKTCYVNTVDLHGKALLAGTCTKQFPGAN